ncbi:IS110 family transposase [Sorangium cellulosum]|uniref:IS110 family transposase n=1 Tax=Sorangium cellulosum TaxID=56 RepID=UPI000677E2A3|nr:transposase [Sorangium cellulosum]
MTVVGLDVHKRVVEAVVLRAEDGRILHRERFACTREELVRFATKRLGPKARVALEATTNTWSIVELLRPYTGELVVSNPMRTRAIAEAKVKTDKVDALVLAQLLRADFLPRVWQPDGMTQARRRLTARRASLVSDRTRVKNRIHAVLHQRLMEPPVSDLFGTKGMRWLQTLELDAAGRLAIDSELRLLRQIEIEITSARGCRPSRHCPTASCACCASRRCSSTSRRPAALSGCLVAQRLPSRPKRLGPPPRLSGPSSRRPPGKRQRHRGGPSPRRPLLPAGGRRESLSRG